MVADGTTLKLYMRMAPTSEHNNIHIKTKCQIYHTF